MFKKPSLTVLFLLALGLMATYQNCAQVQDGGLFSQSCETEHCGADPKALSIAMDLNLVPGGTFKISSNPESGFKNLRLTGACKDGGYDKNLVKVKIYQCLGSSSVCNDLRYINSTTCQLDTSFEISSTVSNLTPGMYRLNLEIVGINKFEQEVYGPHSKLAPIKMEAKQTIRPPVLASFVGSNFWAQDKIYYFPSDGDKVSLDGYITGFCDHNPAANDISIKLSVKGSSTYTLIAVPTKCKPVAENASAASSPHRGNRTGFFQVDVMPIFMKYTGGTFVTCVASDTNCINNPMNSFTNRLVALAVFQLDTSFNYEVFSVRSLILHFKDERNGKGWLVEPLIEVLRRVKKSFNFSSSEVTTTTLDGSNSGMNDFMQASRILTSVEEFYDPLVTTGDARYGFGTRSFIVQWLLSTVENISPTDYPALTNNYPGTNGNIYLLGSANTVPYKGIASGIMCGLSASLSDPITGTINLDTDTSLERIALCLAHRFLNGLYDAPYSQTYKTVQQGVMFTDNNTHCFYQTGGVISDRHCSIIVSFLNAASKMKTRHLGGVSVSTASDSQMKFFGNGLTQYYINTMMDHLAYRNTINYVNENEIFSSVYAKVYPELTDSTIRQTSYPTEFNFDGSTSSFGGTRRIPRPAGSYTYPSGN